MGIIASVATGIRHTLGTRTLVGRADSAHLRLKSDSVSAEHAVIFLSGGEWFVRDLGSTNGTWLNGSRLAVGEKTKLLDGAELCFGDEASSAAWRVTATEQSGPRARCIESGEQCAALHGLLQLPTADAPTMTIFHDDFAGQWSAESESECRHVQDQGVLQVGDQSFLLELPPQASSTSATERRSSDAPSLDRAELRFMVSSDEEHVDLELHTGELFVALPPRSFHYLLVTLARKRLAEHDLPLEEQGWVHVDDLLLQLRVSRQKLNLDVSRARRQFAEAGVQKAARLIERRPQASQLRLGVARLAVGP